ncbi:MAG: hypothetical protein GY714_00825 [Desulfobacterales bacterium]|nr:hypothetical protein [Desulfobacterales bacterium]MCP4159244.1 hypothetical protein [Deltaproteobacteria bacterium]
MKIKFYFIQLVTISRIPLSIAFALMLFFSQAQLSTTIIFLGLGLLMLIEFSDLSDGYLARSLNLVSEWGAMLDPYADSISRLIVYGALAYKSHVIMLVPLVMAIRDITVAYSRIILTKYNKSVAAKKSGKIKAVVQGVGAVLVLLGPLYWDYTGKWTVDLFSWIIIVTTAISAYEYARSAILVSKDEMLKVKDKS